MCEEFPGTLPSALLAEIDRLPAGLLEEIVEARAYGRAYAVYQQNPTAGGELVQTVKAIDFELAQEAIGAQ